MFQLCFSSLCNFSSPFVSLRPLFHFHSSFRPIAFSPSSESLKCKFLRRSATFSQQKSRFLSLFYRLFFANQNIVSLYLHFYLLMCDSQKRLRHDVVSTRRKRSLRLHHTSDCINEALKKFARDIMEDFCEWLLLKSKIGRRRRKKFISLGRHEKRIHNLQPLYGWRLWLFTDLQNALLLFSFISSSREFRSFLA